MFTCGRSWMPCPSWPIAGPMTAATRTGALPVKPAPRPRHPSLCVHRVNVYLRPFLDAMPVLADPGYEGAGHGVHVPVKKPAGAKELDINTRARNALLRSVRCLGERGFALLTQRWKTLQHVTASPGRIGLIARAAFVLVLFEH